MIVTNIGLPHAGKTEIGKRASLDLGLGFVDIDDLLREKIGDLQSFIDEQGREAFESLEQEVLLEIPLKKNTVYAPGGSFILYPEVVERFWAKTELVYFKLGFDEWMHRLGDDAAQRGIVGFEKGAEHVYNLRNPLLQKAADVVIPADDFAAALEMYKRYLVSTSQLSTTL